MEHQVVSRQEWLEARRNLLIAEKEATRQRDRVNAQRMALPWVRVETDYRFDTPQGQKSLADLFDGRSQLIVYHFMFDPDWEAGCTGCSFLTDHLDGALPHLNNHDVTLVCVSRAPLAKIEAYKRRMGWTMPWVSSHGSGFNSDFHVTFSPEELASGSVAYNFTQIPAQNACGELPGLSSFYRNPRGEVFHTYSSYARGPEELIGTLMILDRAPFGRNEEPNMDFVRRHDEYADAEERRSCHS